ncbi:sarcosine oxidase subunit delta [Chthonobacter albigriseus]|uniref:sarcosine oxidase subunit delta n=1 Tax=Chthonobacter albigriseus TaxID=1683161 RepID=UPI0015EF83D6|nr:sarcosine oxidase subunit delta [Chthonobacter albigriseus]
MRITCPHCGPRDLIEFTVLGEARTRPAVAVEDLDSPAAVDAFAAYVYDRANPAGIHREHWFHGFGCQTWLVVTRDTLNHAVLAVADVREERP